MNAELVHGEGRLAPTEARAGTVARLLHRLRDAWEARRRYTRTVLELESLSDRDLADIGLSRYEIRARTRGLVYREPRG